ncbi:MAG: hypothetical protein MK052_02810 [Alphaproteobacteria bacterium]|nr:hypothetical protein [Alphaproteobacteria bacterium]
MMTAAVEKSSSFVSRVQNEDGFALEAVYWKDRGVPVYAVVLMPLKLVPQLRKDLKRKDVMLEEYGEVLVRGEGEELPEGLIDELYDLVTK